jgi:hypothetical protein
MITLRTLLAAVAASLAHDEAQAANAVVRTQPVRPPLVQVPLLDPLEQVAGEVA